MTVPELGQLPYVDEHSVEIEAEPERVWAALLAVVEASFSPAARRYARLVGCADTEAGGPRPLASGSTLPGFHIGTAEEPRRLDLLGAHHFSRYGLIFHLDPAGPGRTRLRAQTRAVFPGLKGRAYRALVIGTRMHVLVTRRLLGGVKRRAERG